MQSIGGAHHIRDADLPLVRDGRIDGGIADPLEGAKEGSS
jgi:hypothetical protein